VLEAARARHVVLSVEEVAKVAGVEPGHVYTALQALNVRHRWLRPEDYLPSIASRLDVSEELRSRLMSEALTILASRRIHGSPKCVAATALYAVARKLGVNLSMESVAKAAEVSVQPLKRWRELL